MMLSLKHALFPSLPCHFGCKRRKQSCSACCTLKVLSARRKCMLKNCPIVLMRFLMQIGHDTWLWPLDVFQYIISLIHCSKHCVYINLGMEGVIQAYQEQQWAGDSEQNGFYIQKFMQIKPVCIHNPITPR